MQLQAVNNNKSGVNFQSKNNKVESASAFVNMNDAQVKELAYVMSYEQQRHKKKHHNALNSMFYAIPIVDTIASGIMVAKSPFAVQHLFKLKNHDRLQYVSDAESAFNSFKNASLKNRMKAMGSTAKTWAVLLGVIGVYNLAKNVIVSSSKPLKHFQQDNPVASFIVDMGLIIGGFMAGVRGLARLENKFPKTVKEFDAKSNKLLSKLNKTKLNTKYLPKMAENVDKFAQRMPGVVKAGRFALLNSVWILFGLGLIKMGYDQHKARKNFDKNVHKNFKEIKKAQLEVAKHINNVLVVEKNELKQSQPKITDESNNEAGIQTPIEN